MLRGCSVCADTSLARCAYSYSYCNYLLRSQLYKYVGLVYKTCPHSNTNSLKVFVIWLSIVRAYLITYFI